MPARRAGIPVIQAQRISCRAHSAYLVGRLPQRAPLSPAHALCAKRGVTSQRRVRRNVCYAPRDRTVAIRKAKQTAPRRAPCASLGDSTVSRVLRMKRDARRAHVADHLPHLGHKRRRCASCARKGGRGATRAPPVKPTVSRATRATSIRIRRDRQFVRLLHVCLVSMERARRTRTVKIAR